MTKRRIGELQRQYPVKAEFYAAVDAEVRAEGLLTVADIVPAIAPAPLPPVPSAPETAIERCIRLIREDLAKYPDANDLAIGPRNLLAYFDGSIDRFKVQYGFWEIIEKDREPRVVYDIGTPYPFTSRYWAQRGARVTFGCLGQYPDVGDARFKAINLCDPPRWPPADLIILTEVLEHLPCNVVKAFEWVAKRASKWLVVSFPLGGLRNRDYDQDIPEIDHEVSHEHIREFSLETSGEFIERTGMDMVADVTIPPNWVYHSPIRNVLLRRGR